MVETLLQETAVVLGAKIRARRRRRGLSQKALALLCGIERAHLTRIELAEIGEKGFGLAILVRIATALETDVRSLLPKRKRQTA